MIIETDTTPQRPQHGGHASPADAVRKALRDGPKTLAEIAEFCGRESHDISSTVHRLAVAGMVDADRKCSPMVYTLAREPMQRGEWCRKKPIEGTRDAEIEAADSIDESYALPDPDPDLNAWYLRTRDCRRCTHTNGLRRLCGACRASLPVAGAGLKHNVRQAHISVGKKFSQLPR